MLVIDCPFCGPRDEREFTYCGPAAPRRPDDPEALSDSDWVDYLVVPVNQLGPVWEYWWHARGCGGWVRVRRDTVTHEISRCEELAS